MSVTFYL